MAFQEFYCDAATGSNINAGDNKTVVTSTNGGWSTVTNIFTAAAGTPFSGVNIGDYAALYNDSTTPAVFLARVTAIGGGGATLTLSSTAKAGGLVTTTPGISCTVGGVWLGPNAASGFPFTLTTLGACVDGSGNLPRINMKSGTNYAITAIITNASNNVTVQGYQTSAGDGLAKAIIDGGNPAASFGLLSNTGTENYYEDLIFQNNAPAGTGASAGVSNTGRAIFRRVVAANIKGNGFVVASGHTIECEAYNCNAANNAGAGGFSVNNVAGTCVRCYAHGCTGSNNAGFAFTVAGGELIECISAENQFGVNLNGSGPYSMIGVDTYNNASHGIQIGINNTNCTVYVENGSHCNNGGDGIAGVGTGTKDGLIANVAFGSGTAANTAGQTTGLGSIRTSGLVTLPTNLTPWAAPTTGNFSIALSTVQGAGVGSFTQTQASKTGTLGHPDIGAAQSQGGTAYFGPYITQQIVDPG